MLSKSGLSEIRHSLKMVVLAVLMLVSVGCSQRMIYDPQDAVNRLATQPTCKDDYSLSSATTFDRARLQKEVDRLALPLIEKGENVGMVVAVSVAGSPVQTFGYGYRDLASKTPMSEDTVFALGSVTKSLVVSLLLVLDEKKLISLDDEIGGYLPADTVVGDPRIKKITFRQLASHTSGLPREPVEPQSLFKLMKYTFTGENIYSHLDEHYVLTYLREVQLPDEPENKAVYSNMGIGLMAYLITLHMHQDLESLLHTYLFEPLHMSSTVIALNDADVESRLATGYAGDQPYFMRRNTPLENWVFSPMMVGTGGVYSTAPDLMRFLSAQLGYSNNAMDQVFLQSRNIVANHKDQFLTMGWYVDKVAPYELPLYYYHGMISGFNAYIGFEPSQKIAVVVLRNNFNWYDKVGHNLLVRLSLARQNAENTCLSAQFE